MRKLMISVIIVAVAGSAGAATYYVDSDDGHDDATRNGGPLDPWRTITYALSRVSGENTFMCRGTFEEEVTVAREDGRSVFTANREALLAGFLKTDYETGAEIGGFHVRGYAASGSKGGVVAKNCYFVYPEGCALHPGRFHGGVGAYDCIFEDCGSVASAGGFEYGGFSLGNCEVRTCRSGVSIIGSGYITIAGCEFYDVERTAVFFSVWEDWAAVSNSYFDNCNVAVWLSAGGGSASISRCELRRNGVAIRGSSSELYYGKLTISNNIVTDNRVNGVEINGNKTILRGNVIKRNEGHGVYIYYGAPDLGTPADPGGNTLAGNKSGYDVYNASSENIPAYGNAWDPQSEQEMEGKTWKTVNVTRIYDHWDNPNVGYVMWSEPVGVAPASLGRIKASFKGAPTSGQAGPASKAVSR